MSNPSTVFVSMPAQDDEETAYAIDHAFSNAEFPERVFIGIALTSMSTKYLKEIKKRMKSNPNIRLDYKKQKKNDISTLGIGQGRTRASKLYQNEDYMLQIDCHSYLDKNWDSNLINYFKEAKDIVNKENFVISCIPPMYFYDENDNVIKIDEPATRYGTYVADSFFIGVVPQWTEIDSLTLSNKKFIPAHKLNPACVFGDKNFAVDPGICPTAIFYDEDWTQQLYLFGKDFSFVFPNFKDFPVRHLDGDYQIKNHKRLFFTEYLSDKENKKVHQNLVDNYKNYISDPKNQEAIKKYRAYSKADAKRGYFSSVNNFIPKDF